MTLFSRRGPFSDPVRSLRQQWTALEKGKAMKTEVVAPMVWDKGGIRDGDSSHLRDLELPQRLSAVSPRYGKVRSGERLPESSPPIGRSNESQSYGDLISRTNTAVAQENREADPGNRRVTERKPADVTLNREAELTGHVKDNDGIETEESFEMVDRDTQSDAFLASGGKAQSITPLVGKVDNTNPAEPREERQGVPPCFAYPPHHQEEDRYRDSQRVQCQIHGTLTHLSPLQLELMRATKIASQDAGGHEELEESKKKKMSPQELLQQATLQEPRPPNTPQCSSSDFQSCEETQRFRIHQESSDNDGQENLDATEQWLAGDERMRSPCRSHPEATNSQKYDSVIGLSQRDDMDSAPPKGEAQPTTLGGNAFYRISGRKQLPTTRFGPVASFAACLRTRIRPPVLGGRHSP